MKIVYSHVSNRNRGINAKQYIELYALSNFLVKKNHPNFQTVFYGDEGSLKLFSNIQFDNFEIISNNILKDIPRELWTLGKLCSMLQVNEPFLHIDGDMLLFKPLQNNFLNKDIICFHDESFFNHAIDNMQNVLGIQPEHCQGITPISYNCGIFGGQDFKSIHYAINTVLNFVVQNKDSITNMIKEHKLKKNNYYFDLSILVEQVWLFQILKFLEKEIYSVVRIDNWYESFEKMTKDTGYLHLLSDKKNIYSEKIKEITNKLNIKY
jgi:hypothetical protein